MVWQNISYGRRYESSSRNDLIVGGRSKGIIGMVLYSKACRKCDAVEKIGEESEENEWTKNFDGSSKSMVASAIMKILEDE